MFFEYYGFAEQPFNVTSDTRFMYANHMPEHIEIGQRIRVRARADEIEPLRADWARTSFLEVRV